MLGFRFIKFQPSEYVFKYRNGDIVKEGDGLSFYYYAPKIMRGENTISNDEFIVRSLLLCKSYLLDSICQRLNIKFIIYDNPHLSPIA
jgi:hypothetical protein